MKHKITAIAIAASASAALAGCGASTSPDHVVDTFLHAAAAGDGSTACAQLSAQAKQQLVKGISCENGMKLLAGVFAATIKDVKLTDVRTRGATATVLARYKGRPMTTYALVKSGDKWLINRGRKMTTSSTTTTTRPSQAQVTAVSSCLARKVEMPMNAGADSAGGVPMVVLTVQLGGYTKGMLDVFASAAAARSAYPAIKARESKYVVKLLRNSVVVYFKHVPAAKQRLVESCG